ncbi:MAG: Cof-type HAD-IIB family hydrolase [Phascolarctobacterium sp.]|uniref:Cof-type HAD-IIB family hydrolase n=1 Tax=Phascolarctobacterium sp. TaxID=2049039 RepID=UPI0026DB046D|nr:Cof-type HAD-IIB family hydrolase [Phascolarctobacterium sp.]MDO4922298.1 Cof-type HAD-IIB family hydrolase [Phascolarctobacterium sp.]
MEIKLIACDMDDTLLNKDCKISPRNAAAVKKAVAAGRIFLIATGRMYVSVRPYAEALGLDVPLVTYNGALVKGSRSGKVFYEHKMELSTAREVLAYCREKGYYLQLYVGDSILIKEENECSRMYSKISGIPTTAVGDDVFSTQEAPYKILVMTEAREFNEVWRQFAERFAGKLDVTSSKDNFLELMEPGVNKWEAVKAVAASYGVIPEEIMCVGDSNNDVKMIANAGIGVAMGNAKDAVKNQAKIITASNDNDGVALVIESILTRQAEE